MIPGSGSNPPRELRVIQIHVTRRCNLACAHCYSSSSPSATDVLPISAVARAIDDAVELGYNAVSFSGGEPLVYPHIHDAVTHGHDRGLVTSLVTNGMMIGNGRLARCARALRLLAVSVDGVAATHNTSRGHPKAFERMHGNLGSIRRLGIPFGLLFTLTQSNLDELEQIVQLGIEEGASLLQVHPLEATPPGSLGEPSASELAYAFLEVARLTRRYGRLIDIHYDVADRARMADDPSLCGVVDSPDPPAPSGFAAALPSLVVEPDGTVVPLQYGFGRSFEVGNLLREPLAGAAGRWIERTWWPYQELCRSVRAELLDDWAPEAPFVNWFQAVSERSQTLTPVRLR